MNRTFTESQARHFVIRSVMIVAFIFMLPAPHVFSDEPDKTLHNKCIYPTVMISSDRGGGSGTIVRSEKVGDEYHNVVLSCAHILQAGDNFTVRVPKYKDWSRLDGYDAYPIRPYRVSVSKDLSIMMFKSEKKMPVADLDFDCKLFIGSEIYRTGFGVGDEMRLDFGKITSLNGKIGEGGPISETYRMNVYTVPGDSGGPVFHKHKVIAITQAIRSVRRGFGEHPCFGISYSIPLSRFKKWDGELNNVLAFVYQPDKALPKMWDKFVEFDSWKYSQKMVPKTVWEN